MRLKLSELRTLVGHLFEQPTRVSGYRLDVVERNGYPMSVQLMGAGEVPLVSADIVIGSNSQTYAGHQLVSVSSINRLTGSPGTGKLLYAMFANWCLERGMMLASHSGSTYASGMFRSQETRTGAATASHIFLKRYGAEEVDVPPDEYSDAVSDRIFVYPRPIDVNQLIDDLKLR